MLTVYGADFLFSPMSFVLLLSVALVVAVVAAFVGNDGDWVLGLISFIAGGLLTTLIGAFICSGIQWGAVEQAKEDWAARNDYVIIDTDDDSMRQMTLIDSDGRVRIAQLVSADRPGDGIDFEVIVR